MNSCTILATDTGCKVIAENTSVWFPGVGASKYFEAIYKNKGYVVEIKKCDILVALKGGLYVL